MHAAAYQINDRPLTEEERLSRFVDDIISLNAEGAATRSRLYELGWSNPFLDANMERATQLANKRFVRQVDADPPPSLSTVQTEMAGAIASIMPATTHIVAHLQACGFSTRHIDLLLPKARARAALGFAHGQAGEMH